MSEPTDISAIPTDPKQTEQTVDHDIEDDNLRTTRENVLTQLFTDLTVSNKFDEKEFPIVLYYGFFFNEEVCTSLKTISEMYLRQCYENVPEFEKFLRDSYAKANGSTDPLRLYKYPWKNKKKKKSPTTPDYHVTSKFCARDKEICFKYWQQVKDMVGRRFLIRIIGLVFTDKTFSFRVKLTSEQQCIFDERPVSSATNTSPDQFKKLLDNQLDNKSMNNFKVGKNSEKKPVPSEYNGITLSAQQEEKMFEPCKSRAHVTIGCAKFVNAVQAGEDVCDIVDLEMRLSSTFHKDYKLESGAVLSQFGVFKDAFVVYLSQQLIAEAEFKFKE